MPRSLYQNTVMVKGPAGAIPLAGAAVSFYNPADGTPIAYPLYADGVSTTPLALPYVTGVLGELEVWADQAHRARIVVTKSGLTHADETIDLEYPPEYSASTDDIASAIEAHEAKDDPHDQYLTQDEGDLRYLTLTAADLTYLKLTGGSLTGPLDVQANLNVTGNSNFVGGVEIAGPLYVYNLAAISTSLTVAGNAVETLNHKGAASGYVPLGADTKIPNAYLPDLAITNTFVVTSEAEMLALVAQTGDVCVRLDTTENYILAAEPATVLANWTKLAASTTAGNTTIVKREEFAPAAAATSVALAAVPTQMLSVSRNGVEQSQPAGHYTVAGVTVTFTDAFVAGERVSVVYEVGSSAPAPINGYTKLESDARYEPIDTMYTKAESDARYLTKALADGYYQPIGSYLTTATAASTYLPLAGGTLTGHLGMGTAVTTPRGANDRVIQIGTGNLRGDSTPTTGGWVELGFNSYYNGSITTSLVNARAVTLEMGAGYLSVYQANAVAPGVSQGKLERLHMWQDGQVSLTPQSGSIALEAWGTVQPGNTNTTDLGTLSTRWRSGYFGTVLSIAGASATANQITHAITTDAQPRLIVDGNGKMRWGPGASTAQDTSLERTGAGALRVDSYLGVGVNPAVWLSSYRALQIGNTGVIASPAAATTGGDDLELLSNSYFDSPGGVARALITGPGSGVSLSNGGVTVSTMASVAAGAAQTFTTRAVISTTGTLTLTPDVGVLALAAHGQVNLGSSPWGGFGCVNINVPTNMSSLLTGYVRYGVDIAPSVAVQASATGVTVASINAGLLGSSGAGSLMDNAYAAILSGPTLTNGGTISNAAALYVTNPTTGGAVAQNRAIIHGNTGASLTTAGAWTNAPSWLEGKSDVRYVEGKDVALFADWFTMGWKPARYRYPALTGAEQKRGAEGKPVLRPVTNESEYDHFFTILDEVPQEVREVICVDDTGAISTKDMDGFLAALLQHALQRIVALEAKING